MEDLLGLLAILYVFVCGFLMPTVAIFVHYGTLAGVIAIIVAIIVVFDRGCLAFLAGIAWHVFAAIALVTVFGWWSAFAFIGWVIAWIIILISS
jgi:hypothetical protein